MQKRKNEGAPETDAVCVKLLPEYRLVNLRDVCETVGFKKSTVYTLIKNGKFPPPMKLLSGSSRWVAEEVNAWIAEAVSKHREMVLNRTVCQGSTNRNHTSDQPGVM